MADQGHDGADFAALGGGGTGEDGQESVAGEIAGTADAVHHVAAQDVSAVDVAGDVHFDGGVDGNDPQATDNFRGVADFLRAQQQPGAEELDVLINSLRTELLTVSEQPLAKRTLPIFMRAMTAS